MNGMARSKKTKKKQNKKKTLGTQKITFKDILEYYSGKPILELLDKPVPNLKTVPISTSIECDVLTGLPPIPTAVNLVNPLHNSSSLHIPSIEKEVSSTNFPDNPTPIIVKTASNAVREMGKKNNAKKAARKWAAMTGTMKQIPTKAFMPGVTPTIIQVPTQAVSQATMQPTTSGIATASIAATMQVAGTSTNPTEIEAGNPSVLLSTNQPNNGKNAKKPFTNYQKRKWQKFQQKLKQKQKTTYINPSAAPVPGMPEEPPLPEMSQDGSPNIIAQASEPSLAVSMDRANQGLTIPILQKPNITLKTKKNLHQETAKQLLNWTKPDANTAGNVPGTSATPQASSQIVETPQAPLTAGHIPGSTIPILENRQTGPVPRSSAGSFFMKTQPAQPPPSQKIIKGDPFVHRYPKGVPRSFLLQQEKSLEAGGAPLTADSPIWPSNSIHVGYQMAQPMVQPPIEMVGETMIPASSTIFVETENPTDISQVYSPSDIYSEQGVNPEPPELDMESSDANQSGQKRLSAFQRLGPVFQPKKPKLTINLNLKKDQPVREVVNDTDDDPDKYTPVHLRQDIVTSTDETVVKFLPIWPWRKNVVVRRSATARNSMSVMILEQEKMEEAYEKDNIFIQITVKGYPSTWTKERVLDAILDSVKGYSLIPCFIEFYQHECKFLVLRSRSALIVLHKTGFYIHKDGVELAFTISIPILAEQINFIPRIILRKRMVLAYMDKKLNLSAFTLQDDISHFLYFPLNRTTNQSDCIQLQSTNEWEKLVELNLSHNRLTTISGFDLANLTPKLNHLDLSHNCLEKINVLLNDRNLPLKSLRLEGNPLCHDYIDPDHYVKVIRMMFPSVVEIDGVPIPRKGELPNCIQNYCPEEAHEVAEKFLEIFFPLLDSGSEHRSLIQGMYEDDASLTITYCYKLRYGQIYRNFRNLFLYARFLDEGETDSVVGAMAITKLINRWPHTEHDPFNFTVDALFHTENTTILRIGGVLKLTAETLADDEYLLSFSRTVVLHSEDGAEYKIHNEMVYWYEPTPEAARSAFRVNTVSQKNLNLKIEATTDEDLRDKFLKIFMKLTTMDKKICERCLEVNNWNFKLALEHFTKLLKLNNLDSLTQEIPVQTTIGVD